MSLISAISTLCMAWSNFKRRGPLKGHGNEADFLGFLQKLVPHESLTLPFEPFRFLLWIRGDIRIRKTTPRYHRYGELPTRRISDTENCRLPASLIRGVADSSHHWDGESATPRITDTESQLLNFLKENSLYRWYGESSINSVHCCAAEAIFAALQWIAIAWSPK